MFYEAVNTEVTMRVLPSKIRECLQYGEGLHELVVLPTALNKWLYYLSQAKRYRVDSKFSFLHKNVPA